MSGVIDVPARQPVSCVVYLDDALRPARRNPNRLDAQKYALLKQVVSRMGFTQPICVRPLPEEPGGVVPFEIIDGHHRVAVARELGMDVVPAVSIQCTEEEAEVLRAAMNRLRGEVDLAVMSQIVRDLHDSGWRLEDLTLTGFTDDEVGDLLAAAQDPGEVIDRAVEMPDEPPTEQADPKFVLEVEFSSREDMVRAKKALRKIGKKDMAAGLLALLGDK